MGELEGSCALLPSFLPSGLSVVSVDFNRGDHLPISDKDNHNDKMSNVSRQMFSQKKRNTGLDFLACLLTIGCAGKVAKLEKQQE